MAYLLGTRRGLESTSSRNGTFAVLALDHRQNLRKELHPFESQVEAACRAGASGVLVGRSVWSASATMPPEGRAQWLESEGVARLRRLVDLTGELGRSWRPRWEEAQRPEAPEPGWYARY